MWNGIKICTQMKEAKSFQDRAIGLMFAHQMQGFDGLMIEPCTSIHTFFMKFPIDVIFLDKNNTVVKIIRDMRPWRLSGIYLKARKVLELKAGSLPDKIKKGDAIEVLCIN